MPDEQVRPCNGCGMNRLCRSYERGRDTLWLCVAGRRCYRSRKILMGIRKAVRGDKEVQR